jgi:hypothetical protein
MFARYFFIFLGIISIGWIGYVAIDLVDKKNAYAPISVFGKEDGKILVINRISEFNPEQIPFKSIPKNNEVLNSILPNLQNKHTVFISANRKNLLIQWNQNWNGSAIRKIFRNSHLKIKKTGLHSYQISGYEVEQYKNALYFHEPGLKTTLVENWDKFDKKSSTSLIDLTNEDPITTDVYFKENGKIQFSSKNIKQVAGKHIHDKNLFSEVLPINISNYHFFEKKYAASIDADFRNSPMLKWVDKGFVCFEFKGKKVLLSDYKIGQNPINILNDYFKKDTENEEHAFFKNTLLCSDFKESAENGFYLYMLNDYVIICEDIEICEDIVTQNKIGRTLATDSDAIYAIYGGLPSLVSERYVESMANKFSRTIYKSKILESRLTSNLESPSTISGIPDIETLTMNVDMVIKDFVSFDGKGNCVVLTATGELIYFSNGKNTWIKNLNSKSIGQITFIEQYQLILVTCKNSIHLMDRNGRYTFGGPIELGGKHATQPATYYEWKNKMYFAYPDEAGNIVVFDSRRRLYSLINSNLSTIVAPVDVWKSQKKLFYGIRNKSTNKMFDAERKREFRSFPLPTESQSIVQEGELLLFSHENGNLLYYDQKGIKNQFDIPCSGELKKSQDGRKEIFLSNYYTSQITIFGKFGTLLGKVTVDFSNVENWDVFYLNNKTYITGIDGLENNVYLYELDGTNLLDKPLEGSTKSMINSSDNVLTLTTIIDNYLIQYKINR